jgi:hypothetical protein
MLLFPLYCQLRQITRTAKNRFGVSGKHVGSSNQQRKGFGCAFLSTLDDFACSTLLAENFFQTQHIAAHGFTR